MENREIAQEIIDIKFITNKTIGILVKEFYAIMRKHGIKQGTQQYNEAGEKAGILTDNPEWTLFEQFFLERLSSNIEIGMMLGIGEGYEFPEDLKCY